jgi:hypothetical protein
VTKPILQKGVSFSHCDSSTYNGAQSRTAI